MRDQYKLIVPRGGGDVSLFDVAKDPHERTNIADAHPEIVAELTSRLDAWWPEGRR